MAIDGLITHRSEFGPAETVTRLETAIRANGMRVFARIDHAQAAAEEGVSLRPTVVVTFGNLRGYAELVSAMPAIAVYPAFRTLVRQNDAGETWLSYDDPRWLARRHGANAEVESALTAIAIRIDSIIRKATSPP